MSPALMTERMAEVSPRARARMIGVVYLLYFLTAVPGGLLMQQAGLSSGGKAAATATYVLAHETVFRVGVALSLISLALYVALTALLYQLFIPVNRSLALLAAFFSVVGCAVQAVGSLFSLAALVLWGGGGSLSVFTADQVQALGLVFLKLNGQVGYVALVFFGLFLLLIGYLIVRSTFMPRFLGVLQVLAGVGWLTVLWPPLANTLLPYIEAVGILAEGLLMLWLLVVGIPVQRWKELAEAAGTSPHA